MAVPIKMLRLSKGMEVGRVITWLKHAGDAVSEGEPVVEVETEKSVVELEAIGGGVVLDLLVPEDEEVPVGTVLGWIGQPGEKPQAGDAVVDEPSEPEATSEPEPAPVAATPAAPTRKGPVRAAPALRRLANEHGIDLQTVAGTGPGGRLTKDDIDTAIAAKSAPATSAPAEQDAVERIPLKGVRRIMAERMAKSAHTTAAATTVVDVDMGEIAELKKAQPLTYTAAVVKAMAFALKQHGILNASLEGDQIVLHKAINIGVAVDGKHGLTVVTIGGAHAKPLAEVDAQLRELAGQAKQGSLKLDTMESPTFTVTNSGVLGSLMFTPIINPPQSAILGMGKVQDTPVARFGGIAIRPVMYLCLTYDHRIVQGEDGRYHLFAARWPKELPFFDGYKVHSEVVRAASPTPEGPYEFQEVVLPARGAEYWDGRMTHNPTIRRRHTRGASAGTTVPRPCRGASSDLNSSSTTADPRTCSPPPATARADSGTPRRRGTW